MSLSRKIKFNKYLTVGKAARKVCYIPSLGIESVLVGGAPNVTRLIDGVYPDLVRRFVYRLWSYMCVKSHHLTEIN